MFFVKSSVFASDNVLQAIQVDGVKDSYNIILKSDDVAEIKKTVQAPNKMILNLHGIRASKTINTIYNNTSSVDSVVVEPTGDDTVKILIQADNVANAGVHFDTLKTPLGILNKSENKNKATDEIVLSDPVSSYSPIYESDEEENKGFLGGSVGEGLKNTLKSDKIIWMLTVGMLGIFILSGMKLMKGNESDIKVGLTQSLKDREIELYRGMSANSEMSNVSANQNVSSQNITGANYGLRAYQQGMRSPYATPEIQRPRPVAPSPVAPQGVANLVSSGLQQAASTMSLRPHQSQTQSAVQTAPASAKSKTANIDSMKFLESMTKIYEKNGRADLAQGLKSNMKKAKANLV